ncbi:hypothetical protein [Actinoplanes siamensis]|uniref:Uncharacterized protein n=1 Tax=Actinoplanes siamensis TaxID=1223317 RepID=A0A919TMU0_9ACTN|nr:hypothetical protein [Actinoplanes siamensis]GIF08721.1 hypothetical protein Asi03nite_62590 [Actinoplanes siamensis]
MTVPTKVPDARFKRADELEPGDWVTLVGDFGPAKILSTYTYDGDMGERRTLVSLLDSDRQVPETTRVFANNRIELLTQAQIDEQRAFIARQQVAAQLRQLADLIVQHRLPLPRMSVSVSLNVETVDQVRHVARALGLEIGPWNRGEGATTSWPRDHKTYEAGVHADWHCYSGSLEQPEPVGSPAQADIDAAKFSTDPMTRAAAEAYEDDEGDEDPTGLTYSREDDDPQVIRPHSPRVPLHVGVRESDGGELVDETPAEAQPPAATVPANAVTVHFSFGPDHTDPTTGESLHRKYVTIVGPSHEACREAMFASRYGRGWGTDYLAGTDQADEWIPHWTEHERIVLDAANADEPVHYLDRGSDGESADRVACGVNVDELDGYTTRPGSATCPACVGAMVSVSESR